MDLLVDELDRTKAEDMDSEFSLHESSSLDGCDVPPIIDEGSNEGSEEEDLLVLHESSEVHSPPSLPSNLPLPEANALEKNALTEDKVKDLEGQLAAARRAILRMNAVLAMHGGKGLASEQRQRHEALMAQVGTLRRTNALLWNINGALVCWVALATGAVMSFVTPQSFEAWREGIAIQLIRRSPQTSIPTLYARRTFGYLIERAFFEIPKCFLAALRQPKLFCTGMALAIPIAAFLRSPVLGWKDDVALALTLLLVAQIMFLGDDVGLPVATQLAQAGFFLLLVACAVLTLPVILRRLHKPRPWAQYRAQILHALRHSNEATAERGGHTELREPGASLPYEARSLRRLWLKFAVDQKKRRLVANANDIAVLISANAVVWMADTLIAHD